MLAPLPEAISSFTNLKHISFQFVVSQMKLSFAAFACALGVTAASQGNVRKLSPGVTVHNSVYSGNDFGMGCGRLGKKSLAENTNAPLIYCFEVVNTGNTRLNNVVLTNSELNGFFDNSINHLEPGASMIVPFIQTLGGDLVNNVFVSATPVHPDGKPIENFAEIKATDSSEVVDMTARARKLTVDSKLDYASPVTGLNNCIQKQWEESGNTGELICAKRDAYIRALAAQEDSKCVAGYTSTLTIDASIVVTLDSMFDLGWYIDTSGGDAMEDKTCYVNGLIEPNEYNVFNAAIPTVPFGSIMWRPPQTGGGGGTVPIDLKDDDGTGDDDTTNDDGTVSFGPLDPDFGAGAKGPIKNRKQRKLQTDDDDGDNKGSGFNFFSDNDAGTEGDGDECGDVYLTGEGEGLIDTPITVEVALACEDQNDDGFLDFAICFTWRKEGADECTFATNLPEDVTDGCYCTRYDVPNVEVMKITPPVDDTVPC